MTRRIARVHSSLWVPSTAVPMHLRGELDMWPKCVVCSRAGKAGPYRPELGPVFPVEAYGYADEGVREGRYWFVVVARCHGHEEALRAEFDSRMKPPDTEIQKAIQAMHFFEEQVV